MNSIPASDELSRSINDFTRAYERWQRAANTHAALMKMREGRIPPPTLELAFIADTEGPTRIAIDLARLGRDRVATVLGPMLDSVYLEYKQSLQDAAMAATSAYRLLELTERAGQVRPDHDRPASFGFGSADPPNRPGIPS